MSAHRAVIATGPGVIRRLCCGTGVVADTEVSVAALGGIDDPVALVDERPVAIDALWSTALRSVACRGCRGLTIVHPSWWSMVRVGVVTEAARSVAKDVEVQPRSWLLTQDQSSQATVVEIADRLVVVAGVGVVAVPRRSDPHPVVEVVEEVADVIAGMALGTTAVVLIDAPSAVAGAPALARSIAGAVRDSGQTVVVIDDARLARFMVAATQDKTAKLCVSRRAVNSRGVRPRARTLALLVASGVVLVVSAASAWGRHGVAPAQLAPTPFLVEGRVALMVPADWPTQRVAAGTGSARVQVTSPSDPEVALYLTQSPVVDETLSGTAERLKRAIDAEPDGVFVDFNPAGRSAGRPVVTYREVRTGHEVRWTVWLDGAVQISVGCQNRSGGEDAIHSVCEQAVRSAHAVG